MVQIPELVALGVGRICDWCIVRFKDKNFDAHVPAHNYVVAPTKSANIVLCIITSKVRKRIQYYKKNNPAALKALVLVSKEDFDFIVMPSVVDCNNAEMLSRRELIERIDLNAKFEKTRAATGISEAVRKKIINGIISSPLIKPAIKKDLVV
jgi:hypothetical protein